MSFSLLVVVCLPFAGRANNPRSAQEHSTGHDLPDGLEASTAINALVGLILASDPAVALQAGRFGYLASHGKARRTTPSASGDAVDSALNSLVGVLWDSKDSAKAMEMLKSGSINLSGRINGKTILHYAAVDGHDDLVRVLIEKGADINAADEQRGTEGYTSLHWAAMYGHVDTCKALVELGADRTLCEKSGMTAVELAKAYDHDAIAQVLESEAS